MKASSLNAVKIALAAMLFAAIVLGSLLQTKSLQYGQNLKNMLHCQTVYVQSNKLAQLLNQAGTNLGRFSMRGDPAFAEKFNKANKALPGAMEDLGNLGPFEGAEAETVSLLKQNVSESMQLLAQARAMISEPQTGSGKMFRGRAIFKGMQIGSEKIEGNLLNLLPEGDVEALVEKMHQSESEEKNLRRLTIAWLVVTLVLTASLTAISFLPNKKK